MQIVTGKYKKRYLAIGEYSGDVYVTGNAKSEIMCLLKEFYPYKVKVTNSRHNTVIYPEPIRITTNLEIIE